MNEIQPVEPISIEAQEKLIDSIQGVITACEHWLNHFGPDAEDRQYIEDLMAKTQTELERQREKLEQLRLI